MDTGRIAFAPILLLFYPHSFDVPSRVWTICLSKSIGDALILSPRVLLIYLAMILLTLLTAREARLTLESVLSLSSTAS